MSDRPSLNPSLSKYGFKFGSAEVNRLCSDKAKGWIVIGITTPKYLGHGIQIYVTKTGKVKISDKRGEWKEPKHKL